MKRAMQKFGDEARAAFAKVGVLMASARRTAQALHPTNLHVNEKLFPRDTIQSRLPDPQWLEQWLDKQIQFDAVWETKVVDRILHNMSLLLERSFASVQELNRYRKEVTAKALAAERPVRFGRRTTCLTCRRSSTSCARLTTCPRGSRRCRGRWCSPTACSTSCTAAM